MSSHLRLDVLVGRSGASVKNALRPLSGFQPAALERVGSFFSDIAGGIHSGLIHLATNATQATATITFSLVAAGDTVTVGSTVFTGANSPSGTSQFQTNVTPSAAADIVAAASLATEINLNTATSQLVTAVNVAGTAVVTLTVQTPGTIGNFLPVSISAHGVVSGGSVGANTTLLTAATYAVLAQSAITNTGNTLLNGDLGLYPGTSVTGFPPGLVSGTKHITDAAAAQAQVDVTAAAVALKATSVDTVITSQDLGSYTAIPGHYKAAAAGTWSAGALTLNGAGTYIFEFVTSLTLPANASIILTGGATADKVYFITGTFTTFGADNVLYGNFLAGSAITTASNTVLHGRLLTYGASGTAVTFPSAGVIVNPFATSGTSGGSEDSDVVMYNGIREAGNAGVII